jgi:hypothetical protein
VELANGEFIPRWEERHPELPSAQEYLGEAYWSDRQKRLQYRKLYDVVPSKGHEKTLTEQQAFVLWVAVSIPGGFERQMDALWG